MFVPIAIGVLTTAAYVAQSRRKPQAPNAKVQAERAVIYETLINDVKDADTLRKFSNAFREQGCIAEADMLLKRAALRELPPEAAKERRDAYKKGMASKNPAAIRELANAFDETGATGAAVSLRDYAHALEINQSTVTPAEGDENPNPGIEKEDGQ